MHELESQKTIDDNFGIPFVELSLNGKAIGKIVPGAFLEAAVAWNGCFFLVLSDGFDFEDSLSIHLLNANLDVLDSVCMSGMYSHDTFRQLTLVEPDILEFSFFIEERRRITLFVKPEFRVPLLNEPHHVSRRFGFRKRRCTSPMTAKRYIVRSTPHEDRLTHRTPLARNPAHRRTWPALDAALRHRLGRPGRLARRHTRRNGLLAPRPNRFLF